MSRKEDALNHIVSLLKANGLTKIFLKEHIYTSWPDRANTPYTIAELVLREDGEVTVGQYHHYRDTYAITFLKDFPDTVVSKVEETLTVSIKELKNYRVTFEAEIIVVAASEGLAKEYVRDYPWEVRLVYDGVFPISAEEIP